MMTHEQMKTIMFEEGRRQALDLQSRSAEMTGTELNAEDNIIPEFKCAKEVKNMLERNIGFVCKSSAGRVVKLLQPYDSDIYKEEPEQLSTQWGFVWSKDPAKALPFVAISTSPYMKNDCCSENGEIFRSLFDNNVWAPSAHATGWELVNM